MRKMGLHELISLTFDSDPKVRRQAAVELSKYDAPGAMFALVELTYDKDSGVQQAARELLDEMKEKNREPELMSFADVFSKGENGEEEKDGKEEKESAKEEKRKESAREKMLKPIEQMFEEKLGKEKAEEMKKRMMPTIEKMYEKAVDAEEGKKKAGEGKGKAVQSMLEEYLDVIAHAWDKEEKEPGQKSLAEELGLVSTKEMKVEGVLAEAEEGAIADEAAKDEGLSAEEEWSRGTSTSVEPTMFKLAFDSMMASRGDEKIMREAMKKLLKSSEEQIKLAFKVAKKRYTEINLTNITELKSGMRSITTGPLYAKSVEHSDYQRTKTKRDTFTRIVVADQGGNEGVIYLFEERGMHIKPGMKLKVERGYAKTYDWSGETAMTVSKKGSVYVIV